MRHHEISALFLESWPREKQAISSRQTSVFITRDKINSRKCQREFLGTFGQANTGPVLASTLTRLAIVRVPICDLPTTPLDSHCITASLIKSTPRKFVAVACKSVSTRAKVTSPRDFAGAACKCDFPTSAKVTAFELRSASP